MCAHAPAARGPARSDRPRPHSNSLCFEDACADLAISRRRLEESSTVGLNMRPLRVGVIDLVTKGPERSLFSRLMNANLASIMPQVVAVWCERQGHKVTFICFTGHEDLFRELPEDVDLVFIGAFTESAYLAYAL